MKATAVLFLPLAVFATVTSVFAGAATCENWIEVVRQSYRVVLDRDPLDPSLMDNKGLHAWIEHLHEGMTPKELVRRHFIGIEYNNRFVKERAPHEIVTIVYNKLLARDPGWSESEQGVSELRRYGFEAVIISIMSSPEYVARYDVYTIPESFVIPHSPVRACLPDKGTSNPCGTLNSAEASIFCDSSAEHAHCWCNNYFIIGVPKCQCDPGAAASSSSVRYRR